MLFRSRRAAFYLCLTYGLHAVAALGQDRISALRKPLHGSIVCRLLSAAVFVEFAAAAGAGVVATHFQGHAAVVEEHLFAGLQLHAFDGRPAVQLPKWQRVAQNGEASQQPFREVTSLSHIYLHIYSNGQQILQVHTNL